jgi:Fe-Mn family superoxide dismutase
MSRETLEFHHDKHHLAYVDNANNLMKGTEFDGRSVDDVVRGSSLETPVSSTTPGSTTITFISGNG